MVSSVPADDDSFFTNRLWVGRLEATLDTLDGHWTHKLDLTGTETDTQDTDVSSFGSVLTHNIGDTTKFGYTSTYRLETPDMPGVRHFFTGRVERERQTFEQPTDPTAPDRERHTTGFVGEARGEYFDTLFLTASVRRDDNDFVDDFTTWRTTGTHQAAADAVPPALERGHRREVSEPERAVRQLLRLHAQSRFEPGAGLRLGCRASRPRCCPDARRSTSPTSTRISPTRSISARWRAAATFSSSRSIMTGKSTRSGIEVAGRYLVGGGLTLGASYTYLDSKDDTGREEVRRPPHSGRIDANYAFDGGRAQRQRRRHL